MNILKQKKKIDQKKNELEKLKSRFIELKKLVYEYKDFKESEIKNLIDNHDDLIKNIDQTKNDYNRILEDTTKQIDEFVERINSESHN